MPDAPQSAFGGQFFWAKTTTQTTGKNLTCSVYKNRQQGTALKTGVTVYCAMLDDAAVTAVGVWVLARKAGQTWDGLINVPSPEPV